MAALQSTILRWSDSCDHYAEADAAAKYEAVYGSPSLVTDSVLGTAWRFAAGDGLEAYGRRYATVTKRKGLAAWHVHIPSSGWGMTDILFCEWVAVESGGTRWVKGHLAIEPDGTVSLYKGPTLLGSSAAGAFPFDTRVRLEYRVSFGSILGSDPDDTGHAGVAVNGVDVLWVDGVDVSFADTGDPFGKGLHGFRFGNLNADGNTVQVNCREILFGDSPVIPAPAGSGSTTGESPAYGGPGIPAFLARWSVAASMPTADGDVSDWTATGAASDYLAVNENPPDADTSYVRNDGTALKKDTVLFGGAGAGTLTTVFLWMLAKTEGTGYAGGAAFDLIARRGSTEQALGSWAVDSSYRYWPGIAYSAVDVGGVWTAADVQATNWGVRQFGGNDPVRVTQLVLECVTLSGCDAAIHAIPDLVAHWRFDEAAGAFVGDDGGANHHGAIDAADYTRAATKVMCTGQYALDLNDGAVNTTRVEVPHDAALNVSDFTIVAWFNPDSTFSVDGILTKHASGDVTTGYYFGKTGFGYGYVSRGDGAVDTLSYTGQVLTGGQDWFLAGGADATTIKLWLQGQPVNSATTAHATDTTNTDPLYLGYDIAAHPAQGYFSGRLDDVALYSRLLTDDEILSLYTACRCVVARARSRSFLLA